MGAGGVWRETYKYGLCDNGGMVVGMIARVEIVVMKKSMKPIIQKFHGPV
jgi:hypothetical protein